MQRHSRKEHFRLTGLKLDPGLPFQTHVSIFFLDIAITEAFLVEKSWISAKVDMGTSARSMDTIFGEI